MKRSNLLSEKYNQSEMFPFHKTRWGIEPPHSNDSFQRHLFREPSTHTPFHHTRELGGAGAKQKSFEYADRGQPCNVTIYGNENYSNEHLEAGPVIGVQGVQMENCTHTKSVIPLPHRNLSPTTNSTSFIISASPNLQLYRLKELT